MARLLLTVSLLLVLSQAHGYRYIGCYRDSRNRDLPHLAGSSSMSAARCDQLCSARHYKYFGLQFSKECWCGNSYGKYGRKASRECSMRCTGNHGQMCGNSWRNSVYATSRPTTGSIGREMAAKVRSMTPPMPRGVVCSSCLIRSFQHRNVRPSSEKFPFRELNARMSRYPLKARNKLRMLQFGANAKTTFEDSKIQVGPNHATKTTYFGIAHRVNNQIRLGMVSAEVVATLVHKYNHFRRRVCRRILFWKRCKTHTIRERRGYHGNEIRNIDTALQSETMRVFASRVRYINV